jgi:hypothetical protein
MHLSPKKTLASQVACGDSEGTAAASSSIPPITTPASPPQPEEAARWRTAMASHLSLIFLDLSASWRRHVRPLISPAWTTNHVGHNHAGAGHKPSSAASQWRVEHMVNIVAWRISGRVLIRLYESSTQKKHISKKNSKKRFYMYILIIYFGKLK